MYDISGKDSTASNPTSAEERAVLIGGVTAVVMLSLVVISVFVMQLVVRGRRNQSHASTDCVLDHSVTNVPCESRDIQVTVH